MRALRPRGFTLVEVLISLALLATILMLLTAAFTGAGRAREALTERGERLRRITAVLDRLGLEIQGAAASRKLQTTAFTCREEQFTGHSAATLIFTAFTLPGAPGGRPGTDIVKLKYFPRLSRDGRFVELFREEAAIPLVENRIPTVETLLAERLSGYRFEFFDGTEWTKEWPKAKGGAGAVALPARVAVVLVDEDGKERRKVVPVPLAGSEDTLLFSGRRSPQEP